MTEDLMTIEEMKQHEWVVGWSGGKDSTTTIIKMHECGVPIKEIIYVRMMYDETLPATLPVMTQFVDRTKALFESWGYPVKVVKSIRTVMDELNTVYKRSKYPERNGHKHGVANLIRGYCSMTRNKINTIERCTPKDSFQMIGYAIDEKERVARLGGKKQSIMVALGITEKETFDICKEYNLLSPLYELGFPRDGCWFCPSCGKRERAYLRENHPDLVEKIWAMCDMCEFDLSLFKESGRNHWVEDWFKMQEERN